VANSFAGLRSDDESHWRSSLRRGISIVIQPRGAPELLRL
jgi:hypothetical protein